MLVKKKLNEITKVGTFTQGFKDCKKIKRAQFRRPSKLADKVNC